MSRPKISDLAKDHLCCVCRTTPETIKVSDIKNLALFVYKEEGDARGLDFGSLPRL